MKLLAGFYAVCAFLDWFIYYMGRLSIRDNQTICYKKDVLLVNSNLGALYMFGLSTIYYTYALVMWYIFYEIPVRFGQISRFNVDELNITGRPSQVLIMDAEEENLKDVVREFEYDRRFTKKQLQRHRAGSDSRDIQHHNGNGLLGLIQSGTHTNLTTLRSSSEAKLGSLLV